MWWKQTQNRSETDFISCLVQKNVAHEDIPSLAANIPPWQHMKVRGARMNIALVIRLVECALCQWPRFISWLVYVFTLLILYLISNTKTNATKIFNVPFVIRSYKLCIFSLIMVLICYLVYTGWDFNYLKSFRKNRSSVSFPSVYLTRQRWLRTFLMEHNFISKF